MHKDTIKNRLYQILLECARPLNEKELVEEYIARYPDYGKNYTQTKSSPKQKIRGTIQSCLKQNSSHPNVVVDETQSPYVYIAIR